MQDFYLYILKCSDNSYYIGHTDNLGKRLTEHVTAACSCYTNSRLPIELVYSECFSSRIEALIAEHKIKRWSRKKKEAFINGNWQEISMLAKKKF